MNIRLALAKDIEKIIKYDKHIKKSILVNSIANNYVYIVEENNIFIGWLRYNLFWDNTPFMNMLYILDDYQNKGYGKALVVFWENNMKLLGYNMLLTSTQDNETAKYFYEKLGYKVVGEFMLPKDSLELIYCKELD